MVTETSILPYHENITFYGFVGVALNNKAIFFTYHQIFYIWILITFPGVLMIFLQINWRMIRTIFHCNDIVQVVISKICCIQEDKFLTWKRTYSSSKWRKKIHLLRQHWAKILVLFDLEIFSQTTTTTPDIIKDIGKKQVYQRFDVNLLPPVCNFIKNEILAQVFFCKFGQLCSL